MALVWMIHPPFLNAFPVKPLFVNEQKLNVCFTCANKSFNSIGASSVMTVSPSLLFLSSSPLETGHVGSYQ